MSPGPPMPGGSADVPSRRPRRGLWVGVAVVTTVVVAVVAVVLATGSGKRGQAVDRGDAVMAVAPACTLIGAAQVESVTVSGCKVVTDVTDSDELISRHVSWSATSPTSTGEVGLQLTAFLPFDAVTVDSVKQTAAHDFADEQSRLEGNLHSSATTFLGSKPLAGLGDQAVMIDGTITDSETISSVVVRWKNVLFTVGFSGSVLGADSMHQVPMPVTDTEAVALAAARRVLGTLH